MDMKRILQAIDGISTKPVEGSNDMAKFLRIVKEADINQSVLTEGTSPHKVSLPVQMAMQHYQEPVEQSKQLNEKKNSLLMQYFIEAEEQVEQEEKERAERIKMYSQQIASRVMEKKETLRNTNPCWKGYKPVGTKKKNGRTVPNCVPKK